MNKLLTLRAYQREGGWWLRWLEKNDCPTPHQLARSLRDARGQSKRAVTIVQKQMHSAHSYLEENRARYLWSDLVLEHGQEFPVSDRRTRIRKHWKCFENSAALARSSNGGLLYAEGLCVAPFGGGMLHAWNIEGGKVIDSTWPMPQLNRYFGIVFEIEFLDAIGFVHGGIFARWDPVKRYMIKGPPR